MAEEKKKPGKKKDGRAVPRRKAVPAEKKTKGKTAAGRKTATAGKKPAGRTAAKAKSPSPSKTGKTAAKTGKTAAKTARKPATKRPASPRAVPDAAPAPAGGTILRQRHAGYALIVASAAGIAGVGAWFGPDPMQNALHWAGRAAVQGVSAALIALFLWAAVSRRLTVSYFLVLGFCATVLLVYDATSAWRVDRTRVAANRTLAALEAGQRTIETLTPEEAVNPYVEAYVAMRDIYWELFARSDEGMSRYRAYYEDYTAGGSFLDIARLETKDELWRSIRQIQDLEQRLQRVETSPPELSDLLLTVDLLNVDDGTRRAYAADLRASRDTFVAETAASTAREHETLAAMRQSLEVLLETEGRYRIDAGQIVFEDPEDAARFAGKAGNTQAR